MGRIQQQVRRQRLSDLSITCEFDENSNDVFIDYEQCTNDFYLTSIDNNFVSIIKKEPKPNELNLQLSHIHSYQTRFPEMLGMLSSWKTIINMDNCDKILRHITSIILGHTSMEPESFKSKQLVVRRAVLVFK